MKQYFIDVNPKVNPPRYLHQSSNGWIMLRKRSVQILNNPTGWLNMRAQLSEFDDSQFKAFQSALTEEFVVIQGPPGTGKTFLCLKIAEVLLENKRLWNVDYYYTQSTKVPMLVVCFTNHALDQFLEGLLKFTENIVRVGGQSKNEKLKKYTLQEQKKKIKLGKEFGHALYVKIKELEKVSAELKAVNETIGYILRNDGILDVKLFSCIDYAIESSWFNRAKTEEIVDWLFGARVIQRPHLEERENQLPEMQEDESESDSEIDSDEEEIYEENYENIYTDDKVEMKMNVAHSNMPNYLLNIKTMEDKVKNMENQLKHLRNQIMDAKVDLKFLKEKLNEGKKILRQDPKNIKKPRNVNYKAPQNMKSEDRWNLYFYWINQFLNMFVDKSKILQQHYINIYKQWAQLQEMKTLEALKTMDVVGMTTTGAARLQTTLESLKCRIVIVEEAAEVLESHIVASLTKHCQHLILIGDHQQLRPTTADYQTETKYKLGISLFERMVLNGTHLNTLEVQHRMRPEIASLIVPAIYPKLKNHESVLKYPPVTGIVKPLFFIDHSKAEECDGTSKNNNHEAEYLIELARYLILKGYKPEDITILAAYSGQKLNLLRERKKYNTDLRDVRITVLDNYQGEECKIILLSLVRNNSEGKIGFLKTENRVCVALSRAREGFYIMGNMKLLCNNSQIWPKIKSALEKQNALGPYLTVCCHLHYNEVYHIKKASDFRNIPICLELCTERCRRILCENGHRCPKNSNEDCGPCMVLMKRVLPCQHEQMLPCYLNPNEFDCKVKVYAALSGVQSKLYLCYMLRRLSYPSIEPKRTNDRAHPRKVSIIWGVVRNFFVNVGIALRYVFMNCIYPR